MDENIYEITSYAQAKVISNKLRMKILAIFDDEKPRTSKQLADELGLPASKTHYHVRELAKVGLLVQTETKEKGGIIEKYYLPIAKGFRIALQDEPHREEGEKSGKHLVVKSFLSEYQEAFLEALDAVEDRKKQGLPVEQKNPLMRSNSFYLSKEKQDLFYQELEQLLNKWDQLGDPAGDDVQYVRFVMTAFAK
ncbi:hypothetical protein BVG16_18065 [Paenibacillus selenitireducens]|uniref:Transcriptional regulator n=1 Tax=Paenibacillus selenitireducens TaxID=1324314 RepID=A0A1T2X956_9BACL|nr:helix-turn-helix domain-containing protein [Paenibacillus selenitireducens]OPA76123.1 hypothetical protein BVG16_18065 [Paenibacillus selenitireducens]